MPITEFLLNTPIVRWQREKLARTPEEVAQLANTHGLILAAGRAVNRDQYLISRKGLFIKEGNFQEISLFVCNYGKAKMPH